MQWRKKLCVWWFHGIVRQVEANTIWLRCIYNETQRTEQSDRCVWIDFYER